MITFSIFPTQFEAFSKELAKINKKLVKHGMNAITFTEADKIERFEKNNYLVKEISIDSECMVTPIAGYTVIGIINHKDSIITSFDGTLLEEYRNRTECNHCHTNHYRTKTFILRDQDGKLHQIGTSCVADFTGIKVTGLERMFDFRNEFIAKYTNPEKDYNYFGSGCEVYAAERVFLAALKSIKEDGFRPSSADAATCRTMDIRFNDLTEAEHAEFESFKEYVNNLPTDSNFNNNVKAILGNEFIGKATFGYIAAATNGYIKHNIAKSIKKDDKASEWIGSIGDKITMNLTLTNRYDFDSYYGVSSIYRFTDTEGNVIIWKSKKLLETEIGEKVTLTATIKEHSEFRDTKQTVITRPKFNK